MCTDTLHIHNVCAYVHVVKHVRVRECVSFAQQHIHTHSTQTHNAHTLKSSSPLLRCPPLERQR